MITPQLETLKNYDAADGLQGLEFFPGAIRNRQSNEKATIEYGNYVNFGECD